MSQWINKKKPKQQNNGDDDKKSQMCSSNNRQGRHRQRNEQKCTHRKTNFFNSCDKINTLSVHPHWIVCCVLNALKAIQPHKSVTKTVFICFDIYYKHTMLMLLPLAKWVRVRERETRKTNDAKANEFIYYTHHIINIRISPFLCRLSLSLYIYVMCYKYTYIWKCSRICDVKSQQEIVLWGYMFNVYISQCQYNALYMFTLLLRTRIQPNI